MSDREERRLEHGDPVVNANSSMVANGTGDQQHVTGGLRLQTSTSDSSPAATKQNVVPPVSSPSSVSDGHGTHSDAHRRSSTSSSDTAENGAPVMPISAQGSSHPAQNRESKWVNGDKAAAAPEGLVAEAPHVPTSDLEKQLQSRSKTNQHHAPAALSPSEKASLSLSPPSSSSAAAATYTTFSFEEVMSPRHHNGKRYLGGYLLHRVSMAGGFLKSWKRKYFRLRDHGVVCYKNNEDSTPLFDVLFTARSTLLLGNVNGDSSGSASSTPSSAAKGKANGSLLFILKQVEIVGHQTPTAKVEVPLYLKAETGDDWMNWIDGLRLKIEARKRALAQSSVHAVVSGTSDDRNDSCSSDQRSTRVGSESGFDAESESPTTKKSGVGSQSSSPTSNPLGRDQEQQQSEEEQDSSKTKGTLDENASTDPPEFAQFQSKYLLMKEIGEGSFSIVHKAVNRLTGQLCAVKCCKYSPALEEEVGIMRTLSHPNVVGIEGVYQHDNMYYVVMDYMEDGDLCDCLIKRQRLPEREVQVIISQVLQGLEYLHRHNIVHRDIKPENILLHGEAVKIADFGLAKQLPHAAAMLQRSCGTLEYAAPELLIGQPYGLKSDIFSLGVVLYVLLFGAFPFSIESAAALQSMDRFPEGVDVRDMSCLSRENVQWRSVSQQAQDVILKMLAPRANDRVSAKELLVHPWFDPTRSSSAESVGAVQPSVRRDSITWKLLEMNAVSQESVRLADCQAKGFTELLARGLEVTKYGNKGSTAPHTTTLSIDFPRQVVAWTARPGALTLGSSSRNAVSANTSEGKQRGRVIRLSDIKEVRLGHATDAFLHAAKGKDAPQPEFCLSIVCSWRTLDVVVKAASQREFLSKGLLRLVHGGTSPNKQQHLAARGEPEFGHFKV